MFAGVIGIGFGWRGGWGSWDGLFFSLKSNSELPWLDHDTCPNCWCKAMTNEDSFFSLYNFNSKLSFVPTITLLRIIWAIVIIILELLLSYLNKYEPMKNPFASVTSHYCVGEKSSCYCMNSQRCLCRWQVMIALSNKTNLREVQTPLSSYVPARNASNKRHMFSPIIGDQWGGAT